MLNGWKHLTLDEVARIERGVVENHVYGGPFHIELQPSNICNLDCFFCISRAGRHNEMLDWPLLKNFLVENRRRDLRMVRLTGGGEPLAYKNILDLIGLCGEQSILFENITTNGTLLAPLAGRLAEAGLDWLTVSLNETDPLRYAQTMCAPERDYHKAMDGVRAIVAARDAAPPHRRPRIWLQLFVWKGNLPYVTEMYEFARALGVDTIFFRTFMGGFISDRLAEADRAEAEAQLREIIRLDAERGEYMLHFDMSQELALEHFTHAQQASHNPPISENFPDFRPARPRTEYCFVGWYTSAINARGEVFPCFQYHNMPVRGVGDIHQASMDEIWRGAGYQAFRNQVHDLMRLRGRMEPSDKYTRYIERKCTQCMRCHYTFNLATPDFYARVRRQVRERESLTALIRAHARNAALRLAHRVLQRPR